MNVSTTWVRQLSAVPKAILRHTHISDDELVETFGRPNVLSKKTFRLRKSYPSKELSQVSLVGTPMLLVNRATSIADSFARMFRCWDKGRMRFFGTSTVLVIFPENNASGFKLLVAWSSILKTRYSQMISLIMSAKWWVWFRWWMEIVCSQRIRCSARMVLLIPPF